MSSSNGSGGTHIAELDQAHAAVTASQRRLFRCITRCEDDQVWRADGCRDMAQWLSGRLGISSWAAARWVNAARALEHLPRISAAFEAGTLGLDKVVELARFAAPESERSLVSWARRVSVAGIRRRADLAARRDLEDTAEADRTRYLRHWWFDDGNRLGLEGSFPADQGAVIQRALDRLADHVPASPTDDSSLEDAMTSPDAVDARRADAFAMMAAREISADPDPDRATVVVHAEISALTGEGGGCEIEGGPVVHPEVARRLACDARVQVVLHGDSGQAVGIGRLARTPPQWLLRQLRHRDQRCTFPGCDLRRFTHAHHIKPWPRGQTNLDNLVLVCPFHHKLVHEHRWRVELGAPGTATWYRPDGSRFDPGAGRGREHLDRAPPGRRLEGVA